jgi:hypothetical protein
MEGIPARDSNPALLNRSHKRRLVLMYPTLTPYCYFLYWNSLNNDSTIYTSETLYIKIYEETDVNTVAYLLKARTVKAEKQPLLGNARTQQETRGVTI